MSSGSNSNLSDTIKQHLERYIATDGAEGHMWDSTIYGGAGLVPTLLLTTTGRRTGEPLTLPLIYGECERGLVVVASKGGAPAHPDWYLNLERQPRVGVQVKADKFSARATLTGGAERAALWQQMVALYPPYHDYQERTGRLIPVVILQRD